MEFHQLRYFVAAAEHLSISRAAERLHVSQPALSRQIAVLEDELGVPLFDRVRQRIRLSEAGRFFLPRARQIICDAETGAQQLREQFGGARRTLRLGFLPVFLDDLVAPAMKALRQRLPRARVSLFELSPRAQLDRLRNQELDVALLGNIEDAERDEFAIRVLARHPMAAILPADHPLARRKSIKLAALADSRWISLSDASYPGRREFLRRVCARAGFEPEIANEVDSLALLLWSVGAGEGVAIIPAHAHKLPHEGVVFVPLAAPVPTAELLWVTLREKPDRELSALADIITALAARVS